MLIFNCLLLNTLCNYILHEFQTLTLAQQLDTKHQTGHLAGIEAMSLPVAVVPAAATANTTSAMIATEQTDSTTGMHTEIHTHS